MDLTLNGWEMTTDGNLDWTITVMASGAANADETITLRFTVDRNNVDVLLFNDDGTTGICGFGTEATALEVSLMGTDISFSGTTTTDCTGVFTAFADASGDMLSFELSLENAPDTTPVAKADPQKIDISGSVTIEREDVANTPADESATATYMLSGTATYNPPVIPDP